MNGHPGQLPIPFPASGDVKARELVRVWQSRGTIQMALQPDLWDDPGIWGIVLVDLAKLIAEAYDKSGQMDAAKALELIKQLFEAEWISPTDFPTGSFVD
jgi:hypothetical protein